MLRPQEPILWIFHFDGSLPENSRCVHVNFIDRTDGTVRPKLRGYTLSHSVTACPLHAVTPQTCRSLRQVHGEDEFLFSPYSAFKVRRVHWEASPVADEYEVRRV